MKQQEIQPVEYEMTVYTVGDKEFLSREAAEEYVRNVETYLNNTYYDVLYRRNHHDPEFTHRKIVAVPGLADGNVYHNIDWIPRAISNSNTTSGRWKVVGQHTFSSFHEFSEFLREWGTRVSYLDNYDYSEDITVAGAIISIKSIHQLAQSEKGE